MYEFIINYYNCVASNNVLYYTDNYIYELKRYKDNTISKYITIINSMWRNLLTNNITAAFYWGVKKNIFYFTKDKAYRLDVKTNKVCI